jgi:prophage antirepressor-like protein
MNNPAQNPPVVFPYTTSEIRVFMIDGAPWFVAADVCAALTIRNARDAVSKLDDDEKTTVGNPDARPGEGAQELNIINESGLYSLILTSRKPEAKKFKKWVTAEVLPAIRQTGRYQHPEAAAPVEPLGVIAHSLLTEATRNTERYFWRSSNQVAVKMRRGVCARFGVQNVRDVPSNRLEELKALLAELHYNAWRQWWVLGQLEDLLLDAFAEGRKPAYPEWLRDRIATWRLPGSTGTSLQ